MPRRRRRRMRYARLRKKSESAICRNAPGGRRRRQSASASSSPIGKPGYFCLRQKLALPLLPPYSRRIHQCKTKLSSHVYNEPEYVKYAFIESCQDIDTFLFCAIRRHNKAITAHITSPEIIWRWREPRCRRLLLASPRITYYECLAYLLIRYD